MCPLFISKDKASYSDRLVHFINPTVGTLSVRNPTRCHVLCFKLAKVSSNQGCPLFQHFQNMGPTWAPCGHVGRVYDCIKQRLSFAFQYMYTPISNYCANLQHFTIIITVIIVNSSFQPTSKKPPQSLEMCKRHRSTAVFVIMIAALGFVFFASKLC